MNNKFIQIIVIIYILGYNILFCINVVQIEGPGAIITGYVHFSKCSGNIKTII